MNDRVAATIHQYEMIQTGDSVMVCVSGGTDSMALLSVLLELKDQLGIGKLSACHFNHGLRGVESDAEEQLVAKTCAGLGIEVICGQGHMSKIVRPKGESEESFARALRYAFFERAAAQLGADKIAIAHNKNDLAETALFNLARGTGIRGLRGMPPVRGRFIRPLIEISRPEIEQYCQARGMVCARDSSNADSAYARNRIRLRVMPELAEINRAAVDHIAQYCAQAAELSDYIEGRAGNLLREAENGAEGYDINCLLKKGPMVAKYAIKALIEQLGVQPDRARVELCAGLLAGTLREVQLAGDLYLRAEGGRLFWRGDSGALPGPFEAALKEGENAFLAGITVIASRFSGDDAGKFKKSSKIILNNAIDCDRMNGYMVLRNRREGDRFQPARRSGTRKLKKLFNESGFSARQRAQTPIISDDEGILWVAGYGVCRRAAVTAETRDILYITISEGAEVCTGMC